MRLLRTLTLTAVASLVVAGCSGTQNSTDDAAPPPPPTPAAELLAAYDLAGLEGREIVDRLDRTPVAERPSALTASVRPGELLLSEGDSEEPTPVALPADEFYLSVAPYVDSTHDCYFHSLTGCRGELAGTEVEVTITDRSTGEVLVAEVAETFDNGFVGYWLPSGIDATIEIGYDGQTGSQDISTGPDDPTCLTTVQLT